MAKKISSKDLFEQEDIFKGIRDSAEKTLVSLNKINDEFKQTATTLKQSLGDAKFDSSDSIKKFTAATAEANKIQKQAIEIEKLKEQVRQQAIKSEKEQERLQQERIKTQKAEALEKERLAKQSEKQVKAAENEASAYAKLSKDLNNARKAYKDLAVQNQENTAEGQQLLKQITDLDTQLKKVDATVGQHQRNVGNYEGATANLKTELRALTRELMNMSESDPKFQQMAQRAGELKDQIQDTQAVVKATAGSAMENFAGSVAKVGQVGVAAFQGIESSMVLLGVENEAVLQSMQKLQALAGLGDALKTLGGLGDMLTEIKAGFVAAASKMGIFTVAKQVDTAVTVENTIATGVNTAATVSQTTATGAATTATRLLNLTMLMNPYLLVAAGITAVGVALYSMIGKSKEAEEQERIRKEVNEESLKVTNEMNQKIGQEAVKLIGLTTQLKNTTAGSKERAEMITKINSQYGTTLKNLSDESAFQAQVNQTVKDYIAFLRTKYQLQANEEKMGKIFGDQESTSMKIFETEKKINDLRIKTENERKKLATLGRGTSETRIFSDYDKQVKLIAGLEEEQKRNKTLLNTLKEKNKVNQEHFDLLAGSNLEMEQMNAGKYEIPAPPVAPQREFNNELEKTVDLTKEIQDEQTKQIKDDDERAKAELIINAQRRIEEIQNGTASQTQKAQLIKEININLQNDLVKIETEALKKRKDLLDAEKEFIKKNREDIAKEELQAVIDQTNKELEDQSQKDQERIKAKFAMMDAEQLQEYNKQAEYKQALRDLDELNAKGAFKTQEEYQIALDLLNKKYDDKAKIAAEKRKETIEQFAQKTAEYFKKKSDEKIAQIDKEIEAAQKQSDTLKALAESGNINAQQSLAEQQRIINEANLKKQKELKKQMRMEQGLALFKLLAAKSDEKNPLGAVIKDATGLLAFINSLPAFYDGTEDTGANGQGIDGKGGFHAVLHPNERVVPKSLNDQIGSMSNEQLAKLAQEYQNGRLVSKSNANSSLDLAILANKLDTLTDVIKNKPETNIALGEITQSAMNIVESKRTGNTTVYNRFKVRK
jgi:hypothetical protein